MWALQIEQQHVLLYTKHTQVNFEIQNPRYWTEHTSKNFVYVHTVHTYVTININIYLLKISVVLHFDLVFRRIDNTKGVTLAMKDTELTHLSKCGTFLVLPPLGLFFWLNRDNYSFLPYLQCLIQKWGTASLSAGAQTAHPRTIWCIFARTQPHTHKWHALPLFGKL